MDAKSITQMEKKKSITYIKITTTSTVCTSSTKIKQMKALTPLVKVGLTAQISKKKNTYWNLTRQLLEIS